MDRAVNVRFLPRGRAAPRPRQRARELFEEARGDYAPGERLALSLCVDALLRGAQNLAHIEAEVLDTVGHSERPRPIAMREHVNVLAGLHLCALEPRA